MLLLYLKCCCLLCYQPQVGHMDHCVVDKLLFSPFLLLLPFLEAYSLLIVPIQVNKMSKFSLVFVLPFLLTGAGKQKPASGIVFQNALLVACSHLQKIGVNCFFKSLFDSNV